MKTHIFLKTALVAGLLAISGTSFAAPTTVTTTFTGTIPSSCSVATGAVGTLTVAANGLSMSSSNTGGTKGSFTLTCTGTANMAIAAPTATGAIAVSNASSLTETSALFAGTAPTVAIANSTGTNANSQPSGTYLVDIAFTGVTALAPGSYAASVVTTVTPN